MLKLVYVVCLRVLNTSVEVLCSYFYDAVEHWANSFMSGIGFFHFLVPWSSLLFLLVTYVQNGTPLKK